MSRQPEEQSVHSMLGGFKNLLTGPLLALLRHSSRRLGAVGCLGWRRCMQSSTSLHSLHSQTHPGNTTNG